MRIRTILLLLLAPLTMMGQEYRVRSVAWEHVRVDSTYDARIPDEAVAIVNRYKNKVDSVMAPPLGLSRITMSVARPESTLSNFMADMVVAEATGTGLPYADMGLVNMGGIRTDLPEGIVTVGDAYSIAPFENTLVVLEMKGTDVLSLMQDIAAVGGEAVSSSVRLRIKDGKVAEATIGGEPIDPKRTYTIATINYLAPGNDKLYSLKNHTKMTDTKILLREALMEYILKKRVVDSKIEGRIVIE